MFLVTLPSGCFFIPSLSPEKSITCIKIPFFTPYRRVCPSGILKLKCRFLHSKETNATYHNVKNEKYRLWSTQFSPQIPQSERSHPKRGLAHPWCQERRPCFPVGNRLFPAQNRECIENGHTLSHHGRRLVRRSPERNAKRRSQGGGNSSEE